MLLRSFKTGILGVHLFEIGVKLPGDDIVKANPVGGVVAAIDVTIKAEQNGG